jgi:hypothetical protein
LLNKYSKRSLTADSSTKVFDCSGVYKSANDTMPNPCIYEIAEKSPQQEVEGHMTMSAEITF